MRYNTDELAVLLQFRKSLQGCFEGVVVERSESFIEKERIHPYIPAGHLRKTKRQSKAHDKAFAAGEVFRRSNFACLIIIDDIQLQRL